MKKYIKNSILNIDDSSTAPQNADAMFEKQLITTIGAVTLGFAVQAQAEVDVEFAAGYDSEYFYRGFNLGDQSAWYGLDASGDCDCGVSWNIGLWGIEPDNNVSELDIYGGFSYEVVPGGSVSAGYTAYTYDDPTGNDSELYIGYSHALESVSLGVTYFYGLEGALDNVQLLQLDASYSHNISDKLSAEIAGQVGFVLDAPGGSDGLGWYTISLGLSYAASDSITLGSHITYTEGDSDFGNDEALIGGASIAFAF